MTKVSRVNTQTSRPRTRTKISQARRPYRLSVVIPARNEAHNIAWVLERLPLDVDEVVLVDGRSTDRTVEVAMAVRPGTVVVQDDAPGKGCAMRKGVETATGDFVVVLDADGSMDPREIGRFVEPLTQGHDLVRGSRFMAGGGSSDISRLRKLGNHGLLMVSRFLFGVSRSDLCYGYAAFRRRSFLALELTATGFEIEAQFFLRADRARLSVAEVPSFESPRHTGTSNLHTFRDGWRVLRTILWERIRRQPRLDQIGLVPMMAEQPVEQASSQPLALDILTAAPATTGGIAAASPSRWAAAVRAPDEQAMTAALVWSLAVKHGDDRLRAVALANYREARRQAGALPDPGWARLIEIRQDLSAIQAY